MIEIIERPDSLECDIVNIGRWICFVCMKNNVPFEMFMGVDEDIRIFPSHVKKGKIKKVKTKEGERRYDLVLKDSYGYNITIEGINRIMHEKLHNYTILVSFMLRYLPHNIIPHVLSKLNIQDEDLCEFTDVVTALLHSYKIPVKNPNKVIKDKQRYWDWFKEGNQEWV